MCVCVCVDCTPAPSSCTLCVWQNVSPHSLSLRLFAQQQSSEGVCVGACVCCLRVLVCMCAYSRFSVCVCVSVAAVLFSDLRPGLRGFLSSWSTAEQTLFLFFFQYRWQIYWLISLTGHNSRAGSHCGPVAQTEAASQAVLHLPQADVRILQPSSGKYWQ